MRTTFLALLLVAACGKKGPDPEIARLNGVVATLERQLAEREREIETLQTRLDDQTRQAALRTQELDEFRAQADRMIGDLRTGLEAKTKEALDALAKAGDFQERLTGLEGKLTEVKAANARRAADLEALKQELANLKKLLGK